MNEPTPKSDDAFAEAQDFEKSAFVVPLSVTRLLETQLAQAVEYGKHKEGCLANFWPVHTDCTCGWTEFKESLK